MPVFDQGYRELDAPSSSRLLRWWPVYRQAIVPHFKRRLVLAVLGAAFTRLTFRAVMILLARYVPGAPRGRGMQLFGSFDAQRAVDFATGGGGPWAWLYIGLTTMLVGGGLVARDLQTGALRLYLSRPLSRIDYGAGKLLGVATFVALVAAGPPLVLMLFHAGITGDSTNLALGGPAMPAVLAVCAAWVVGASLIIAGLSAALQSPRLAGLAWLGWLALGNGLALQLARAWPDADWPQLLSIQRVIASIGQRMLERGGVVAPTELPPLPWDSILLWFVAVAGLGLGALWVRLSEVQR